MAYNDRWDYAQVDIGKRFVYSVCETGEVIKTSHKALKESKVKPYLKRGRATITLNGKEYILKNLVASKFIKSYKKGDCVELIDGDPFNCHIRNLRIYSKSEHGKRNGHLATSKKIIVNGVEYRSIRECAKALHVSYQTLYDYLNKKFKNSVLEGVEIQFVEDKL